MGIGLRIGPDDLLIQQLSRENLCSLEEDNKTASKGYTEPFIVTREMRVKKLSPDKDAKREFVTEDVPHNIIYAEDMWDAIQLFEEDSGKRVWIAGSSRQEVQLGVERSSSDCRIVKIRRVRKDCILRR